MTRPLAWLAAALTLLVLLPGSWVSQSTLALSPDSAPPLPAPSGTVVNVSSVQALQNAVSSATSNTTIVIAPGTYHLTSTLWVNGNKSNVTIRGATNNRNDVVLVGQGMNVPSSNVPYGIWAGNGATNLTIANLTIRDIYQHPIMLNAGTEAPRIYNVRLVDGGQQLIKANPDGSGGGVDNGIVEYSVFEYTTHAPTDYTNAIDVHTGRDWIIRHNLFRRIRAPQGQLAGPAVLMWNGSSGTIVEGNTFIDNHRDISLGLVDRTPNDHTGGIIRNNFIVRTPGSGGDVPIAVFDSPSTKVVHNTILTNGQYPNAIEVRFPNASGVVVVNNLSDRGYQNRDGASSTAAGNIWSAAASWFVNPNAGDLHLTSNASAAINAGATTADAPVDWDGQARPSGGGPDAGADEYNGGSTPPADTTAPSVSVTSPSAGAVVSGTTTLQASATDNVGVTGVWFTVDGTTVGTEDQSAPFQVSWNSRTVSNGAHTIRAVARDAAGNTATSAPVTITVSNSTADTTAPTVSLTAPANGATVSGTVTVSASASDNVGVTSVQFTLNGVNLGAPDTSPPYAINWNTRTAANGTHVLRAVARDAAGNTRTSTARTVTVRNESADTTAPTVTLTSPASGATVRGTVTVSASASDNVGVTSVQFTLDGNNLGAPDTSPPYSVSWNTTGAANGTHVLRAIARDAAGNTRTSSPITVTVSNTSVPTNPGSGCTTPQPGTGWTCVNGGWLPPGMPVPSTPPAAPAPTPPSAPGTPSTPAPSVPCTTPRPGASWTCYNGGWLPPGIVPPTTPAPPSTPPASPTPTPQPPSAVPCTTPQPGANWTCYNGGWLPPGMLPPTTIAPPPPVVQPSPGLPTGCSTPRPGANWKCVNGGWLPPGHPGT